MRQRRFTPIIILLVIVLSLAVGYFVYIARRTSFSPNTSLGSSQNGMASISNAIDSEFDKAISLLTSSLNDWDSNFVITMIILNFGNNFSDLTSMYETAVPNVGVSMWVSSPKHQASRFYSYSGEKLTQSGDGTDKSSYGPLYQKLSPQNHIPTSPKNAVVKCMEYARNQGEYLLHQCSSVANEFKDVRDWMCTFLDVKQAGRKMYLWELGFDDNDKSRLCFFDPETNSVSSWVLSGPSIN